MSKRPPPNIHRYVTKKRRFLADLKRRLDWTEPMFKSEEERKQKALENAGKETEPHMLHVVYLLKPLKGRPWWEKKIAEELQIEKVWCILSLWSINAGPYTASTKQNTHLLVHQPGWTLN